MSDGSSRSMCCAEPLHSPHGFAACPAHHVSPKSGCCFCPNCGDGQHMRPCTGAAVSPRRPLPWVTCREKQLCPKRPRTSHWAFRFFPMQVFTLPCRRSGMQIVRQRRPGDRDICTPFSSAPSLPASSGELRKSKRGYTATVRMSQCSQSSTRRSQAHLPRCKSMLAPNPNAENAPRLGP